MTWRIIPLLVVIWRDQPTGYATSSTCLHTPEITIARSQEAEASKQIAELSKAVESASANNDSVLKNQYIEGALEAWKRKGQAVDYLNSLTNVTNETKAEIFRSACLRHKGREPKNNPFLTDG
ncbi:hypothetical protein EZI54_14670 [Marinobacter halodurans]|uniref:Uncharacterized protein n=1 Tax=Marinobacter halodurans TaxID=2528979 RepID=A0ABY1ZIH8_9GAMM|nr:hypothetical protein [Marinobacter halodurans]TBW54349.1 hypothetical protein EZI54_14670 [Marinobacter halodurans]